ncbi:MAG: hypothetical protein OXG04_21415 [Acidobacteria bacterium]|nr:hypothetical protein [Acidobacteriota bacterium]
MQTVPVDIDLHPLMSSNAPIAWLFAGLGCAAGGVILALSVSPETGIDSDLGNAGPVRAVG